MVKFLVLVGYDINLVCDSSCSERLVSCYHNNFNSGGSAFENRKINTRSRWVIE